MKSFPFMAIAKCACKGINIWDYPPKITSFLKLILSCWIIYEN